MLTIQTVRQFCAEAPSWSLIKGLINQLAAVNSGRSHTSRFRQPRLDIELLARTTSAGQARLGQGKAGQGNAVSDAGCAGALNLGDGNPRDQPLLAPRGAAQRPRCPAGPGYQVKQFAKAVLRANMNCVAVKSAE